MGKAVFASWTRACQSFNNITDKCTVYYQCSVFQMGNS